MLIVEPKKGYRGKYYDKIVALVNSGTCVGKMWVSGKQDVQCHICDIKFEPPKFDEDKEYFGCCPGCQTPFLFLKV